MSESREPIEKNLVNQITMLGFYFLDTEHLSSKSYSENHSERMEEKRGEKRRKMNE